jgi:hypothetical protein
MADYTDEEKQATIRVEYKDGKLIVPLPCGCKVIYVVKHTNLCKKHGDEATEGLEALFG